MSRLTTNTNLTICHDSTYRGYAVQNNHGGIIAGYMDDILKTIDNALLEHPRTFAFRIDLRFPGHIQSSETNVITKFFESLKAQIQADLKSKKKSRGRAHPCTLRYVWVKEQYNSANAHYHCLILLNGHAYNSLGDYTANEGNTAARVKKAWASALGISTAELGSAVHFPENPAYTLDAFSANLHPQKRDLVFRASYLAKPNTKPYGDSSNHFGCSRK